MRGVCGFFFFFQAEDGIRDVAVTGVQTCALPILSAGRYTDRTQRLERGSLVALSGRSPMADQPVVAMAGPAMSRQYVLLATKLHVPSRRPGFVPRPRLVGRLEEGLAQGLVLVCAPAGSGKTV